MDDDYLHLVMCYPDDFASAAECEAPRAVRLYMSTPSHRVRDYLVFWTRTAPYFGFASDSWFYLGTLSSLYGIQASVAETRTFASDGYVEAYLFRDVDEDGDFGHCFYRASGGRPYYRFRHYRINTSDPADFWTATEFTFVSTVDRRDLGHLQRP